ncbi:MAG: homoserine dehydrogenase [Dehalococcoidia bacterium]
MPARRPAGRPIGIGLLGMGVVGSGVVTVLLERADLYARRVGRQIVLRRVLVRDEAKSRSVALPSGVVTTDPRVVLEDDELDIIIEVMGGEHPALEYISEALERGRSIVTANKEVMAKHGPELLTLARGHSVEILYEASVGGGIPLIAPLQRDLLANEVLSARAIINGTTNYILTRMSREGVDFGVALKAAQELGYAEADPTNDVEAIDAAYKLAILASLAFRSQVRPDDIYREGITQLTARDFRYAQELGYAIKLLAICNRREAGLEVRVHPAFIPLDAPLAKVDGVFNAVQLEGDLVGGVLFQGRGAGSLPTTSAVVADVLDLAGAIARESTTERFSWVQERSESTTPSPSVIPIADVRTRYYLRVLVNDEAGVIAKITAVLGEAHGISIASIIQKETDETAQTAELVFMTHEASESAMQGALSRMRALPVVVSIGSVIRVEG